MTKVDSKEYFRLEIRNTLEGITIGTDLNNSRIYNNVLKTPIDRFILNQMRQIMVEVRKYTVLPVFVMVDKYTTSLEVSLYIGRGNTKVSLIKVTRSTSNIRIDDWNHVYDYADNTNLNTLVVVSDTLWGSVSRNLILCKDRIWEETQELMKGVGILD